MPSAAAAECLLTRGDAAEYGLHAAVLLAAVTLVALSMRTAVKVFGGLWYAAVGCALTYLVYALAAPAVMRDAPLTDVDWRAWLAGALRT